MSDYTDFFPRRRHVVIIENDTIQDGIWHPHIIQTLRDYIDHLERTSGSGYFPRTFKCKNGNKLTAYSGTCCEEPILGELSDHLG